MERAGGVSLSRQRCIAVRKDAFSYSLASNSTPVKYVNRYVLDHVITAFDHVNIVLDWGWAFTSRRVADGVNKDEMGLAVKV
jgi:hypothetical protein